MQCYQCGARIRPGLSICSNCGARLDASTEYEDTGSAGLPAYGGDDGSYDVEPGGSYRARDEIPGQGRRGSRGSDRGYGHDSYRNKADPLEDPRAPRFFKDSDTPAPRPDRRQASGRNEGGYDSYDGQDSYRDSAGRGSPPGNIPSDRRRPQPETRGERRSPRSAYDGSDYRDGRERRSAAALAANQVRRPYPTRDQADGYGQNGRRDRASGRSRMGQDRPVLQLRSPAWTGRGRGSAAAGSSSMPLARRRFIIFAVVAVTLLLSIGAVAALRGTSLLSRIRGGAPTSDNAPPFVAYTPGPTPAPPAGYKEFDSPHSLYVLDYPQSWSTSSSSSGGGGHFDNVDDFTRTSPLASVVVEEAGAFSSISRSEIIQAEVQGANAGGRTFTQISNPITTVEIAGEQWLRADYLITETDGTKFHMAILACHHNQRGYALVLLGLANTFSQDTGTVFEPILKIFHFTG
jgi:hypothetical protein